MGLGLRAAGLDTTSVVPVVPVVAVVAVACSKNADLAEKNNGLRTNQVKNENGRFSKHMAPFDKPMTFPGTEFRPDSREIGPET